MMTAVHTVACPIWQPVNLILARGVVPIWPSSAGLAHMDHGPVL
jgi:hypothetical protein